MRVLVNIKCIQCPGGVAQIFKILELDRLKNVDYFIASPGCIKFLKPLLFVLKYIEFFVRVKKYDIVHINPSLDKNAVWRDLIYLLIAKLRNKKVIIFMHGWEDEYALKIKNSKVLSKYFAKYNKADAFFVLGDIFKQKLLTLGINKEQRFFIETTIADDRYIAGFNIQERITDYVNSEIPVRFLFISRITSGKGMELAIDIFSRVQEKTSKSIELIIAGDGDKLEETKQYVAQRGINNVFFAGYVEDKEKHELFMKCDIMLFPTMYGEGLPNSVLEGMLYGMPIVSRINAGIPDWIKNNENGFVTKSTLSEDFVPFIVELLINTKLYSKIAENNHKIAKENFIRSRVVTRFLNNYRIVFEQ